MLAVLYSTIAFYMKLMVQLFLIRNLLIHLEFVSTQIMFVHVLVMEIEHCQFIVRVALEISHSFQSNCLGLGEITEEEGSNTTSVKS